MFESIIKNYLQNYNNYKKKTLKKKVIGLHTKPVKTSRSICWVKHHLMNLLKSVMLHINLLGEEETYGFC